MPRNPSLSVRSLRGISHFVRFTVNVHRERNDGEETFCRHGEVNVTKLSNQAYSNDDEIAIQLVRCP
jgi:hypothetical protein